jgi:hypothetical protein
LDKKIFLHFLIDVLGYYHLVDATTLHKEWHKELETTLSKELYWE